MIGWLFCIHDGLNLNGIDLLLSDKLQSVYLNEFRMIHTNVSCVLVTLVELNTIFILFHYHTLFYH